MSLHIVTLHHGYENRIPHAPRIVMEPTLAGAAKDCIALAGSFTRPLLVCDENTCAALGKRIAYETALTDSHVVILPSPVHADRQTVEQLQAYDCDVMIAVGSGTINDLVKFTSFRKHIPYVVFPTAPSMNGYGSPTASIEDRGFKSSHSAHMPRGIFCDMEVIAAVPYRLIRSGIGDAMCRSTCQVDWYMSHVLLGTPYDADAFDLIAAHEKAIITHARLFGERNPKAVESLMKALLMGGLCMAMCGGSYPASQGEHLLAHTMGMFYPDQIKDILHGEEIAVTTLVMEQLQRHMLQQQTLRVSFENAFHFADIPASLKDDAKRETEAKYSQQNQNLLLLAPQKWESLRHALNAMLLPEGTLKTTLETTGCPLSIGDLGWNPSDFSVAQRCAHLLRNRFTFLDLWSMQKV